MKSEWIVKYDDNEIKVTNSWFSGEKPFVNNELQEEQLSFFHQNQLHQLPNLYDSSSTIFVFEYPLHFSIQS
jgi:hypothetical protein